MKAGLHQDIQRCFAFSDFLNRTFSLRKYISCQGFGKLLGKRRIVNGLMKEQFLQGNVPSIQLLNDETLNVYKYICLYGDLAS